MKFKQHGKSNSLYQSAAKFQMLHRLTEQSPVHVYGDKRLPVLPRPQTFHQMLYGQQIKIFREF